MIKHGRVVWWPDRVNIGHKAMLIRADASPREEIWRFIKTIVSIFLTKYKAWSETREDMEDLENMCYTAAYCRLLHNVRTGQYRRDLSFYLNVRSAVLGSCYNTYKVWLRDMREKYNLFDGNALVSECQSDHSSMTFFDMVATEKAPRLRTNSEIYCYKITDWHQAKTPAARTRVLNEQAEDEYSRYCEDCAELGVEPVDKVTFVCNSYTDEEKTIMKTPHSSNYKYQARWLAKARRDPVWCAKRKAYNKNYYQTKRKKAAT
jgi:hypothetical protein